MEQKSIGQIISENRKKQGLTQKALADQLNITDKAVSKWERDIARPDIHTIPKLAEILDVPPELLINIPLTTTVEKTESSDDFTVNTTIEENDETSSYEEELARAYYKVSLKKLLVRGIIGFLIGFGLWVGSAISDGNELYLWHAVLIGLLCSGIPYGWELCGRWLGSWFVLGSFPILIIAFLLRATGAVLIGFVAYPIALLFTLIKVQKKGSKLKIIFGVLLGVFIAIVVGFLVLMFVSSAKDKKKDVMQSATIGSEQFENDIEATENAETSPLYVTDVAVFSADSDEVSAVCQKALERSQEMEKSDEEANLEIVKPSEIHKVYFATVIDPTTPHSNWREETPVTNALFVVTSYTFGSAGISGVEEWSIMVYPNYTQNADGSITYEVENEHDRALRVDSIDEVYEWICEEYSDMNVAEVPLS